MIPSPRDFTHEKWIETVRASDLEPEDAHEVWKQTAEHFGYDTSTKIPLAV